MRLAKPISWLLLCGLTVLFTTLGLAAQDPSGTRRPGQIVAVKVQGTVRATNLADRSEVVLTEKAVITQNYVITTDAASSVILLFSNGSTLNIAAESTLSIDEFMQDPFSESLSLAELEEEPTTSVTKLTLSRGELVGNVKKIKQVAGSSFTVNTPVGAAGIRGTTFRIVFRPDASGRVFFTLSTQEGTVLLEAPAAQQEVSVATGNEVVVAVDVEVDAATGTVTLTSPPVVSAPQEIPPATQAAISAAAQQIVEAASSIIIEATPQAGNNGTSGEEQSPQDPPQEQPQDEAPEPEPPPQPPPPPPPPTTPSSNTTPGDGLR